MNHQLATQSTHKEQLQKPASSSMLQSNSAAQAPTHPLLRLQRTVGNQAVQRMIRSEQNDMQAQHTSVNAKDAKPGPAVPSAVHNVLKSSGQPLTSSTRAFMEPRFGEDFSQVRVHTDAQAADSARQVNALAYTVGSDVVFGADQYAPETSNGKKLLAHELTHVVQQHGNETDSPRKKNLHVGVPGDAFERQADAVAKRVTEGDSGAPHRISATSAPTLQRVSLEDVWEGAKSVGRAVVSAGEEVLGGNTDSAGAKRSFVGGGGTSGGGGSSGSFDEPTPAPMTKPTALSAGGSGGSPATAGTSPSSGGLSISFLPDIILFDEINYTKELFSKDTGEVPFVDEVVDIPYVGPVSLVALTRGIATSQLFATIGPGVLQKITITIDPFASRYSGSAELFVPFGGGAGLTLNGSVSGRADYLGAVNIAALKGGLNADGAAKLVGDVTVTPEIIYDKGDITFTTQAQLETCLQLIFKLNAFLEGSLLSGLTSRLKFRKNWSLVDWMWQYCYELGASLSISYIKGKPSVSLDFTGKPISFKTMIHDLLENASGSSTMTPLPAVGPTPVGPGPSPMLPGAKGPTGLDPSDPIGMRWFKHPSYYPSPIDIGGFFYERDNPTALPHGEPIGVPDEYWPYISKTIQKVPSRRGPNASRFRTVLEGYGFSWAGLDADHVQDIQWDGPDLFENLWPMDSSANRSAGPRQNRFQLVVFSDTPGDPAKTTRIDDPALMGRWFEIIAVDY